MSQDDPTGEALPEQIHGCPVIASCGQTVLLVARERYPEVVRALADDSFDLLVDLTAVDYSLVEGRTVGHGIEPERFEVVVNLTSMERRQRIRLRVQVPETDPTLPTLFNLHPGSEALEREVFDMFGIAFDGHPDLTRILMPEDWVGHPLRKDYDPGRIPVQFKGAPA